MKLNSKIYDVLAWIGKIVLPALSVLYGTIGRIWNLPFIEEIPMTIMAVDVFLNALLGISSANYYKEQNVKDTTNYGEVEYEDSQG